MVARKQQQSSVWKCVSSLTTDRHCCHAIVFKLASEQRTDQILDDAAKIRSASAAREMQVSALLTIPTVFTSGRFSFMHNVVILYCEELGKLGGQICLPASTSIQKNNLFKTMYNAPILQTTDFVQNHKQKQKI